MSIAIGIHAGLYILIVTDTRMCFYPPSRPAYFRDGIEKTLRTSTGLMTGTGYGPLLDAVKVRLSDEDPGDTTRISALCTDEQTRLLGSPLTPRARDAVARGTGWMFTYIGHPIDRGEDELTMGDLALRLGMAHACEHFEVLRLTTGSCPVIFSEQVPLDAQDALGAPLRDHHVCTEDDLLADSVTHNVLLCSQVVAATSEIDPSVSSSFQVALDIFDGTSARRIAVAPPVEQGQPVELRFDEDLDARGR
ncbi:MAG TPA: hypothetical protein VMF13_20010 [Luteitalea sp.]|nr:hypothetical protein [Luteitalea sp.]